MPDLANVPPGVIPFQYITGYIHLRSCGTRELPSARERMGVLPSAPCSKSKHWMKLTNTAPAANLQV